MLEFLFRVMIGFGLCYIIYRILTKFKEAVAAHEIYMVTLEAIKDQYLDTLINSVTTQVAVDDNDDNMYDKTDEELIEDWNNLWDGNPPCELDIQAIREEERKEREKKGE